MEEQKNFFTFKQKIFYLISVILIILASNFALMYKLFIDQFGDKIVNSYIEQDNDLITKNLKLIPKNSNNELDTIDYDFNGGVIAITEDVTYCINGDYHLFINDNFEIYEISINYNIIAISNHTLIANHILSNSVTFVVSNYYETLPSLIYNIDSTLSFELVQYQSTSYYSLKILYYLEQNTSSDSVYNFDFYSNTIIDSNSRPIFLNSFYIYNPFDFIEIFGLEFAGLGYDDGYDVGYVYGYDDGYDIGYGDGLNSVSGTTSTNNAFRLIWSTITNATNSFLNVFDFYILPGVPLYAVIAIPIIIAVLFYVLKVIKK